VLAVLAFLAVRIVKSRKSAPVGQPGAHRINYTRDFERDRLG
jgi:hypothetical protein